MKNSTLRRLPFLLLVAATLACQTLTRAIELPDPEGAATDMAVTEAVGPAATPLATPLPTLAEGPLRPEFADDLATIAPATDYDITLTVEFNADGSATLTGRAIVRFTNPQSTGLNDLYLMLWPNYDDQYSGQLELGAVEVDGAPVAVDIRADTLAARLPLAAPLAPNATAVLSLAFTTTVERVTRESGIGRFAVTEGDVLIAPTFYPLIPRLSEEGQWLTDPAPSDGDTTNSDTSVYRWTVTAPAEYAIVGSGAVVEASQSNGSQTQTLVTGPMRDLALTVGPLTRAQREVQGVMVNAYLQADNTRYADELLDYAAGQIEALQDQVGAYPYSELDIVDATGSYPGVEYPGLIYVGAFGEDGAYRSIAIHEVAHQWFYGLIGNDQLLEPWLDEAAASYAEVLYTERWGTTAEVDDYLRYYREAAQSASDPTQPIGLSVAAYGEDYGPIVYAKGALFFHALRKAVGDEAFFDFLRRYYAQNRYGFATSAAFQAVAETTCGCDLQALFDVWVYDGGEVEWP